MAIEPKKIKLPPDIPPLTYGVWINGTGWLRSNDGHYFADPRMEYAKAALRMWKIGDNTPARIELIDESMIGLRDIFIERERMHDVNKELNRKMSFKKHLRRWLNVLLG
jgi:hypothetical protein